MKQQKVASTPIAASKPAPPRGPRYRYFSTTPTTVTLRMRDLQVPQEARATGYDSEKFVDLPCAEIFRGAVPKIPLSRLAGLVPDCVTATGLPERSITVCAARLALAFVVTEGREQIEESPAPPQAPVLEEFAPPAKAAKPDTIPQQEKISPPTPVPAAKAGEPAKEPVRELPKELAKDQKEAALPKAPEPSKTLLPVKRELAPPSVAFAKTLPPSPAEKAPEAKLPPQPELPPKEAPSAIPAPAGAGSTIPAHGAAKRPFALFPLFRRKEVAAPKPSVEVPRSRIEIPKPKHPNSALTQESTKPVSDQPSPAKNPDDLVTLPPPKAKPEPRLEEAPPKSAAPLPTPAASDLPAEPLQVSKQSPAEKPASLPAPPPPPAPAPAVPVPPVPTPGFSPVANPAAVPAPPEKSIPPAEAKAAPVAPAPVAPAPAAPAPAAPAPAAPAPVAPAPVAASPKPPEKKNPPPEQTPPAVLPAVLVETEHIPKSKAPADLPEQDALQAIFLTEEFLSLDRVLELCGTLPGIQSCILSQRGSVVSSHNTPDSVDIVSLSAHAQEMLQAMRSSSAKMGIGAVPAVTVHSEKGPITFFHEDDLCLLVLHKDRGFVPGVREKLQQVVSELSQARLPAPAGRKMLGP